ITWGIVARMQPGPGAGLVLPAVTAISTTRLTTTTIVAPIATRRSRRVSCRGGVLARCQCPSSGMTSSAGQVGLEDPECLDPEAEPLAVVAGRGVEAGQLLPPLEPVGHRVAMGEDRARGRVHVAVVAKVGLEG